MVEYLKAKLSLSERGAKDLIKASISCCLRDISLMTPIFILYLFLKEILVPVLNNKIVDISIVKYSALSIISLIIIFIFQYIQYNKTFFASYNESENKRISLAEKLRILPLSYFGKKDLSDLTTTIMGDCAGLETAFSHYIPQLIGSIVAVLLSGIGMMIFNFKMAIALLWVIPVSFIIVILGRNNQNKVNKANREVKLKYADSIQECIETMREIKSNNISKEYLNKVDDILNKSEKMELKTELNTAKFVISAQMLLKVGLATVVLVGSSLLVRGETDLLTFIVFLMAASRIYDPLSEALINLAAIIATLIQIKRMQEIESQDVQVGLEEVSYKGCDVKFDHVVFSYNDNETVLNNVSFVAKQGEVTALVGPSGGGKSTVAKLAARFWDINEGKITLGGVDVSKVDPETLLKKYSIVFQDVLLFNNTIMENIRIGKKGATDEEVIRAAKLAKCDEFINKMTQGYNTVIGENGSTLSGGERQRISIARALLKDADVILLDEATASLDVENETKIQEAISELIKDKTVIIIAHRLRTVEGADKIVFLKDGHVAEMGSPKELREKNGLYANMIELQEKSSEWQI